MACAVEYDCHDQHASNDHAFESRRDVEGVEPVAQGPHDERADQGSEDSTLTAHQADTADHCRGDRIELVHFARQGRCRVQARGHEHRRSARHQTREGIDGDLVAADGNAREPGRLLVAADRIGVSAELGSGQHEVCCHVQNGHHEDHYRHTGDIARERTK